MGQKVRTCFHTQGPYCPERRAIKHARNEALRRQIFSPLSHTPTPRYVYLVFQAVSFYLNSFEKNNFLLPLFHLLPGPKSCQSLKIACPVISSNSKNSVSMRPRTSKEESVYPRDINVRSQTQDKQRRCLVYISKWTWLWAFPASFSPIPYREWLALPNSNFSTPEAGLPFLKLLLPM